MVGSTGSKRTRSLQLAVGLAFTGATTVFAAPASGVANVVEGDGKALGAQLMAPPFRPITEVDVVKDMADFWMLAGMDEAVLFGIGGGVQGSGVGTLDVAYRRRNLHSAWDLLPTTVGTGLWVRGDKDSAHSAVPFSIGWQLPLGIFSAPYLVANGVGVWTPSSSAFEAGFELGAGYEWRASVQWAIAADARVTASWPVTQVSGPIDRSPWGGRASVFLRRYLGDAPSRGRQRR